MNYLAHLISSFAAAHALNFLLRMEWTPFLFAAVFLGAIIPDVDHAQTKIFRFFLVVASASAFWLAYETQRNAIFSIVVALATAGFVFLIKPKHRGITHSWFAPVVFAGLIFALTRNYAVALNAAVSYTTHILVDRI